MSDYQAIVTEQKQKEENFYDLQGQKDTIESTNKSVRIFLCIKNYIIYNSKLIN